MASLIPDASTYGTQQAYAQQAYDKAKSNIQNQQLGWLKQYGMTANYDQNSGSYNNYRIDPYSQYGLIQQNRNSEALDLNAAQDNSISRGLAGPGLGNQQASQLKYQHGVQDTNLGNTFMQGMGQFGSNLADAADSYQQSLYQAEQNAIQTALANQQFDYYNNGNEGASSSNGTNPYASGDLKDPFANLNNLSQADWAKLAKLPINQNNAPDVVSRTVSNAQNVFNSRKQVAKNIAASKSRKAS